MPDPDGSIGPTDLAILSARADVARFGASRFGFYPDEVEGAGSSEPGEYVWKEQFPPTTAWTLESLYSYCGTRPVAAFSMSPEPSNAGAAVQFTDESTPTEIVSFWAWDFGDGGTSNEQNPTHVYDAAGTYTVTLHISGVHGSASTSDDHEVVVALAAHFTWQTVDENDNVQVDASISVPFAEITDFLWDFGDGSGSSTAVSDEYFYGAWPATYTVRLTVTSPAGTDFVEATIDIGTAGSGSI